MDVVLFGDQTVDCQSFLRRALRRKGLPLLSSFLEQVHVALQHELFALPTSTRQQLPAFSNVSEFAERYYNAELPSLAAESAITCLAQLTHCIGFFEEQPLAYLEISSTQILGVCTGLLAASAVASCNSLTALIPLAVQTVRIAFRLGARVASVGDQLEPTVDRRQTWSSIISGIGSEDAEAALCKFNSEHGLATSNKLYISAVGTMSVTISGPPSVRNQLLASSPAFQSLQHKDITIRGPYHAGHLYDSSDVEKILNEDIINRLSHYSQVHPLISSSPTCKSRTSTVELFRNSVLEILAQQVEWDQLVKLCVNDVRSSSHPSVRVLAMGPTALANSLISALKVGGGIRLSMEDYVSWSSQNQVLAASVGRMAESKIAIVGMAGRFPNAADHEAFWKLLEQGLDVHREVPADRFDAQAHTDASGKSKNKSHTPYGCFIEKPGLFDPRFFNMSPREATQTDPMQRLSLVTAYEAMEMSGFVRDRTPSTQAHRIGTFYGQTSDDWREINAAQDIDTYFITGGVRAFGPGRINYHFGFSGPSFSVDTACSSSMAAIQLACTSLRAGDCDTVFTGGMNVMTNPDIFSGLSKGQFLSKTGSCKTYDNGADGYCRGDGVVTLIMKRLDDALADRDPILGIIAGIATNHSAEAISITHPHVGAQKFLFQKVMDEASVDVRDVKYVEMHGTGTQAGDGVEMESVSSIFAPSNQLKRRSDQPLFVGSVKANVGHGEAVSGATALVKSLLMFQKNLIPPHAGVKTELNHNFPKDLKERQLNIAFEPTPFPRPVEGPRFIFMNNFSAAGGNTATLLEDAPTSQVSLTADSRSTHLVVVTAKSLWSFKQNVQRLLSWIKQNPSSSLPSLAYTTTARRYHYQYRVAIEAKDLSQVEHTLSLLTEAPRVPVSSTKPRVAFAFTGQGSHYLGMGRSLFQKSKQFRRDLEDCDQISRSQGFPSFIGLIDGAVTDLANASPVMTQLAIVSVEIALAQLWKSWGVIPSVVVGHSLGEYAALQVAGVLSTLDTIRLVGQRAQLLVSKCSAGSHGMLAVKADFSSVEHLVSDTTIEKACINGPEEIVFSGTVDQIGGLKQILTTSGFKNTQLNVPYAFHSSQVDSIIDAFIEASSSTIFHTPRIPVISPLLSEVIEISGVFGAEYLARHCRETVDFLGGLNAGLQSSVIDEHTVWVEIGPHPVCSNMIKAALGKGITTAPTLNRNDDAWRAAANSLAVLYHAGLDLDWSEYHHNFNDAHEVLSIPSYSFDEKVYWIDYKENWCLTKGEKQASLESAPTVAAFSTTAVQKIVQETITQHTALVIGESDLAHPLLRAAVEGHLVNGVGLMPSSIYADMALTICDHAYRAAKPDTTGVAMNVNQMEVIKPLVLNIDSKNKSQILQIEAKVDLAHQRAAVTYRGLLPDGTFVELAQSVVTFEDSSVWSSEWERRKFLVQGRIDALHTQEGSHRIGRGMAYKLFSSLVQYDNKYRGMEEVTLNSEGLEATARVAFQSTSKDGKFFMSPYLIDSACHISGFIMNANDAIDSKKQVYISHGWETMRFAKKLDADKRYRSYVKMQPVPGGGKMVAGDVYVFEGDEIIGVVGGLKFQCVPRTLLSTLLSPAKTTSPKKTTDPASSKTLANHSIPPPVMVREPHQVSISQSISTSRKTQTISTKELRVVTKAVDPRPSTHVISQTLEIIAQEIGCEIAELADSINFADLGVDSLMSLSISGRVREELEINFHSTVFNDWPTVGQLKTFLGQFETAADSGLSTPDMVSSHSSSEADSSEIFELVEPMSPEDEADTTPNSVLQQLIRSTIADEMGVSLDEISDNTDLSTMGMDSLMSLSILGALREKTGLTLHSDLLVENTCVEKIEMSLGLRTSKPQPRAITRISTPVRSRASSIKSAKNSKNMKMLPLSSYPPAQSILLQGNPRTATQTLFLLPDGSGSATSYTTLPDIDPSLCVFGLNCPFMKDPESFTIGVEGVTQIYMAEIQRRQPRGPYLLAGWSAGGVLAYEMTRQMIAKGLKVDKLVLIDSPCPIELEALPASFHRYCNQIGLLGTGDPSKTPKWLLPHFAASVRELTNYSEGLSKTNITNFKGMPKTVAIWALDGIVKPTDPKPEWDSSVPMPNSMHWLCNDRHDLLGPNGWEQLVGVDNIICTSVTGNHFTMMRDPITADVSALIKEALEI